MAVTALGCQIPARDFLEKHYSKREVEALWAAREALMGMDLPLAQKAEWVARIMDRLWPSQPEYIQNAYLIQTKSEGAKPFRWNYAQRRFWKDVVEFCRKHKIPIRAIILKARQLGFSTFMQIWQYDEVRRNPHRHAMTVSYDEDSTNWLFKKTHFAHASLFGPLPTLQCAMGEIEFAAPHGGRFSTKTAGAIEVGRSMTLHHVHASEIPVWQDPETTFLALKTSVPLAPFTSIVLEATARGAQGSFYDQWHAAEDGDHEDGQPAYIPFFAPWFWDPEYVLPFADSDHKNRFATQCSAADLEYRDRHSLSWEQMYWRSWKTRDELNGNRDSFKQEYPADAEEAFITTGSPVWDTEKVLALNKYVAEPFFLADILFTKSEPHYQLSLHQNGPLRVWDEPVEKRDYVIGVDFSEGKIRDKLNSKSRRARIAAIGRAENKDYGKERPDYSAASVIETYTGKHVALWHGYMAPSLFAEAIAALGWYYNCALLVPEINGPGLGAIEKLVRVLHYPRIYVNKVFGQEQLDPEHIEYGWRTTGPTRRLLIGQIEELLATRLNTRSKLLVRELRTMQMDPQGVPRAMNNDKDDVVISFGLAAQGRYELLLGQEDDDDKKPRYKGPDAEFWERERQQREENERLRDWLRDPGGLPGAVPLPDFRF